MHKALVITIAAIIIAGAGGVVYLKHSQLDLKTDLTDIDKAMQDVNPNEADTSLPISISPTPITVTPSPNPKLYEQVKAINTINPQNLVNPTPAAVNQIPVAVVTPTSGPSTSLQSEIDAELNDLDKSMQDVNPDDLDTTMPDL